jgi:cobalamin synthase
VLKTKGKATMNNWLNNFKQAWDMLLDLPLPMSKKEEEPEIEGDSEAVESGLPVLAYFPVIGFLLGLVLYFASWLLLNLGGQLAGALVAAFAGAAFLEYVCSGRNFALAVSFIENRFKGMPTREALLELDDEFASNRQPVGFLALNLIFLIKVLCIGVLVYKGMLFWLIIVMTAGYLVQAHLAMADSMETREPLVELPEGKEKLPWLIGSAIILIVGMKCLVGVLLGLLIAAMLAVLLKKYFETLFNGVNGMLVGLGGYLTELVLLLIGVAVFARNGLF